MLYENIEFSGKKFDFCASFYAETEASPRLFYRDKDGLQLDEGGFGLKSLEILNAYMYGDDYEKIKIDKDSEFYPDVEEAISEFLREEA